MKTRAVLQGSGGRRLGVTFVALLAGAALGLMIVAGGAGAARLVGKDGKVYACYRTKGKVRGAVRLVPKKKKCGKGEKKIAWNVAGKHGSAGQEGETAPNPVNGAPGEVGISALEQRVTTLTGKLNALEGVLKGVTNTDLTGMLGKLQGVSGAQLQEAVKSVADVNALCTQATALTSQADALGAALGGTALGGVIPIGLKLAVPALPAPLPAFGCP